MSNVWSFVVFVVIGCFKVVETQFQPPAIGFGSQPPTIRECLQQQSLTVQIDLMIRFNFGRILDDTSTRSTVLALSNAVLQAKVNELVSNNTAIQELVSSLIISRVMTLRDLVQATLNNVTTLTLANTRVVAQNYTSSVTINGGIVLLEQICGNGIVIVLSEIFLIRQGNILSNLQSLDGSGMGFGILQQLIRTILSLPILRNLFGSATEDVTLIVPQMRDLIPILLNPRLLMNYIFNGTLFPADLMLSNSVTSLTNRVLPISTNGLNQLMVGPNTCLNSGPSAATTGGLIYFGLPCSRPRIPNIPGLPWNVPNTQ